MFDFIKKQKAVLVIIIVALLGWVGLTVTQEQVTPYVDKGLSISEDATIAIQDKRNRHKNHQVEETKYNLKNNFNNSAIITPQRRIHILYGDATGGGHLYGTGAPCKSEFPKHWGEDTIIKEVELIASNDNLNWEQQRNGYYVTEHNVGTVKVRVVKGRENKQVITAYPTNTTRNPCPANDM